MLTMYYEPKHFIIQELVPPEIYDQYGDGALKFLDPNMLRMWDGIRDFFGKPVIINNWHTGGQFTLRGFRPPNTTTGALYSQHKFGRAGDGDIQSYTAEMARQVILENQKAPELQYISVMEDDVAWLHADNRNIKANEIILFKP
jgi:hypothetical protein